MNIEDCPVVADALNCQQKTAEEIIHENGDYLLDAKGNQPNLMEEELSGYVKDELLRESMDCKSITEKIVTRLKSEPHILQAISHGCMRKKSGKR